MPEEGTFMSVSNIYVRARCTSFRQILYLRAEILDRIFQEVVYPAGTWTTSPRQALLNPGDAQLPSQEVGV